MAAYKSTKERLLLIIDDIEIVAKYVFSHTHTHISIKLVVTIWWTCVVFQFIHRELIDNAYALKHQKISAKDHTHLVDLLLAKDIEMKNVLKLAEEQADIEQKMFAVKAKVNLRDQQIKRLQRRLKDAEEILSRALFQARQKLISISVANKKPVPSEELIKYAYRCVTLPFQWPIFWA